MQIRDVLITFEKPESFLDEYERNLSSGWIFVPSDTEFDLGEVLEVTLDLSFCGHWVRVLGIVKSRISRELAEMLHRPAGVIVEFADGIPAFEEMMRDTLETLTRRSYERQDRSASPRRHQRLAVSVRGRLDGGGQARETRTRNLSESGALLEVTGVELRPGENVSLSLIDPASGELVALSARVVRQEPAAGTPPSGTQGSPRAERVSQVAVEFFERPTADARKSRFLEQVRAVTQGRRSGGVSGNLSGLSLSSLLQSIASSSERGTMEIVGDGLEAHILFEAGQLRYASLGKVEGIKALARLLAWPEGEFSFQPSLAPDAPVRPLVPIAQAILQAVHQAEELALLEDQLLPDTIILERAATPPALPPDTVRTRVLRALERPACPSALLDALPDSDAEIWRALLAWIDEGVVRVRD